MRRKETCDAAHQRQLIEGVFDAAQKRKIVEKLAEPWSASRGNMPTGEVVRRRVGA